MQNIYLLSNDIINFKNYCPPERIFRKKKFKTMCKAFCNQEQLSRDFHALFGGVGLVLFGVFCRSQSTRLRKVGGSCGTAFPRNTSVRQRKNTGLFSAFHNGFHSWLLLVQLTAQMGPHSMLDFS